MTVVQKAGGAVKKGALLFLSPPSVILFIDLIISVVVNKAKTGALLTRAFILV